MLQDHIETMKRRLAAIDRQRAALDEEAAGLRRMIAAGEQKEAPAAPAPVVPIPFSPWPFEYPYPPRDQPPAYPWPDPSMPTPDFTPWVPVRRFHGGMCACPFCVSPVICQVGGDGAAALRSLLPVPSISVGVEFARIDSADLVVGGDGRAPRSSLRVGSA